VAAAARGEVGNWQLAKKAIYAGTLVIPRSNDSHVDGLCGMLEKHIRTGRQRSTCGHHIIDQEDSFVTDVQAFPNRKNLRHIPPSYAF
jgi:hypothetical protein